MRVRRDSYLEGNSWYLHKYEVPQVVELLYREVLKYHGLLEHIDNDWGIRYLDVAWK